MIIDCHAHFEPRLLSEEKLISNMDEAGVEKTVLIPRLTDPPESQKSDFVMAVQRIMFYVSWLRPLAIGITKTMYRDSGKWNMWFGKSSGKQQQFKLLTDPDNQSVADMVLKYPKRIMGWIFINPCNPDAMDQLEKFREIPGMIGVKIHPFWHGYPIKKVAQIAERTRELNLPMLVHLGFGDSGDYKWLIKNFPKLNIIFGHLGIPYYKDLWADVVKSPNVFMDISSTYHTDQFLIRNAVKMVGSKKCLFGTDAPYAHSDAVLRIKGWVEDLPISPDEKDRIFFKNFFELIESH